MNISRSLALLVIFLNGCASQPGTLPTTQSPQIETVERLLASPPDNWKNIFQINNDNTRLSDFIPPDQSKKNWSTKLSFEAYTTKELTIDPLELLFSEVAADESRCDFVQHFNIFSGFENNYQTSARLFLCGENAFTNQGEIKLIKAIRGNDYLYSIIIIRRVPPFDLSEENLRKEEVALWSNYLSRISLCDGSLDHPCPEPGPISSGNHGQ